MNLGINKLLLIFMLCILFLAACNKGENVDFQPKDSDVTYPIITCEYVKAKPGERVMVNVDVGNNPGVLGMILTADFDRECIELISAKNGDAFEGILDFTPSKDFSQAARFVWDGIELAESDIKDGSILELEFRVDKGTPPGKYPITLICADGDAVGADMQALSFAMKNGYIIVE